MYGSSESQRFFTSSSPSFGAGTGADSMRKLSSLTQPVGRLASSTRLFCIKSERSEAREMMIGVAELLRHQRQPAEGMAHLQLFGHAHAAVQLHRLLADVAGGVGDLDLGGRHRARAIGCVERAIGL